MKMRYLGAVVGACLLLSVGVAVAQTEATYSTAHFVVTYSTDTNDPDTPVQQDLDDSGVPDAVEALGDSLEHARSLVVELGFSRVPGPSRYEVYVSGSSGGAFVRAAPDSTGAGGDSYMVIPPGQLNGSPERLRSLVVHEYMHAVQFQTRYILPQWFMEGMATWVAELDAAAKTADFSTARDLLMAPRQGLVGASGRRAYGSFLFFDFLHERYSPQHPGEPAVGLMEALDDESVDVGEALEHWLFGRGAQVGEMWAEYLLWTRQLQRFEDGMDLRALLEGSGWPTYLTSTKVRQETCKRTSDAGTKQLGPLSGDYVKLRPPKRSSGGEIARLRLEGPRDAVGYVLVKLRGQPASVQFFFGGDGPLSMEVPFARPDTRHVTLALGNGSIEGEPISITYSLIVEGSSAATLSEISGPSTLPYGVTSELTGRVTCNEVGAPGSKIRLVRTDGGGVSVSEETVSSPDGTWRMDISPDQNAHYSVHLVDPFLSSAAEMMKRVDVEPFVTIAAPRRAPLGAPTHIEGTITPVHTASVRIEYRRPNGSRWRFGSEVESEGGSYSTGLVLPNSGVWEIRARMLSTGDSDHVPGMSVVVPIRVVG